MPLASPGEGVISLEECNNVEKQLLCFPTVWACEIKDAQRFSWEHRSLIRIEAEKLSEFSPEWRADYFMYTCLDKTSGMYIRRTTSSHFGILVELRDAIGANSTSNSFELSQCSRPFFEEAVLTLGFSRSST